MSMHGAHGVSGASSMARNCGMKGMHGNTPKKQIQKSEDNTVKTQINTPTKIPDEFLGNKFDVKI